MVLNNEDEILIKNLYLSKKYSTRKLIKEFPGKDWKLRILNYFLKKLCESSSTGRKPGSGMQQLLRMRLTSGVLIWGRMFRPEAGTLNICVG